MLIISQEILNTWILIIIGLKIHCLIRIILYPRFYQFSSIVVDIIINMINLFLYCK